MRPTTAFAFYDERTGKRCGMSSYPLLRQAEEQLAHFRERDARGGRTDLHDVLPHLRIVELTANTWGSSPGEVIA